MQTKSKCQACNRPIKHVYNWNNQELGIDCWKKIALPELKKQQAEKREYWKKLEVEKSAALVAALKQKSFTRIRSQFKIDFLKGLVEQFEEKGFISGKQKQMVYGTGSWNGKFYDYGMLNDKDRFNEAVALFEIGSEENKHIARNFANTVYDEQRKVFFETIGEKDFCEIG